MTIEKYSCLKFKVYAKHNESDEEQWTYLIYTEGCLPYDDGIIESDDSFDTEQEARFAAIGHIDLLENGEG